MDHTENVLPLSKPWDFEPIMMRLCPSLRWLAIKNKGIVCFGQSPLLKESSKDKLVKQCVAAVFPNNLL